jgi:hypothetical protein
MAVTLGQLLGGIRFKLAGLGAVEDASAELVSALDTAATIVALDDATGFSRGVAEVDFELLRVRQVDTNASTLALPSFGRGYKGSAAVAHTIGAEVTFNPVWPKSVVAEAINGVLFEMYPDLYAVRTTTTTVPLDCGPITVPTDAVGVIAVWLASEEVTDVWVPTHHWDFDPDSHDTGRTLRLRYGGLGQGVRILYAARPGTFDLTATDPLTQDFTVVTGLNERVADVLALGVASRLAPFIDVGKLSSAGAEARADAQTKPVGSGGDVGKLLYPEFRARVQAEQAVLTREHPIRLHRTGR